jgi:DNA-binding NtrC family response regulator
MALTTVLAITKDAKLTGKLATVVGEIADLHFEVVPCTADAHAHLDRRDLALLIAHIAGTAHREPVLELLRALSSARRPVATLVVTDQHSAEQTLSLLRLGAADCLDRPIDLARVAYLVDVLTVRARYHAQQEARAAQAYEVASEGREEPFLYLPAAELGQVMGQVHRVAPQDTTILLTGETGTGKTRLAGLIHELSARKHEPFFAVNCAALSQSVIESELFGHVRGAFTGADRDRVGKLQDVGRGTLLLDEIDALTLELQAKLLRVVEERLFEPVGSNRAQRFEARLIIASNRPLQQEMKEGRFRSDLFYRLNVVGFYLPPLRETRTMIQPLAEHFLGLFAQKTGRAVKSFAHEALACLQAYDWPGNVRELRNVIERAVVFCPGVQLRASDLTEPVQSCLLQAQPGERMATNGIANGTPTLAQTKEQAEAARITEALERNQNNRQRAAAELGISRMTLYKKLHRYGLIGGAA